MGAPNTSRPAVDTGYSNFVHCLRKKIVYGDNGVAKTVGVIPAGAIINRAASGFLVKTAFNAGTSNVLDIGISSDDDLYATDLAAGTATFVPVDEAVGSFHVTSETTITATLALSGTAATAGEGYVVIWYSPAVVGE